MRYTNIREDDAFSQCYSLTSVVLPDGVTSMGRAFYYCTSLTSVVLPDSVTTIGWSAFLNCSSLTNVYYKGDVDEWTEMYIGDSNYELENATRYYYIEKEEDVPTDGGNYWHYDQNGNPVAW